MSTVAIQTVLEGAAAVQAGLNGVKENLDKLTQSGGEAATGVKQTQASFATASSAARAYSGALEEMKKVVAGLGIAIGLHEMIKATVEAEEAAIRLTAVLKAQGTAASVTVGQIEKLGDEIQRTTVYTKNQVREAAAYLSTLDNMAGDTIPRTISVATKLASIMQTDLVGAARILGFAMTAPESGMQRLRRAGVILSDQEKILVKQFMDTGDVMKAQDVILRRIEATTGDVAQELAGGLGGSLKQLRNDFMDMLELGPGTSKFFADIIQGLRQVAPLIAGLAIGTVFKLFAAQIMAVGAALFSIPALIAGVVIAVISFRNEIFKLLGLTESFDDYFVAAINLTIAAFQKLFDYLKPAWKLISEGFSAALDDIISFVKNWVGPVYNLFYNAIKGYINLWIGLGYAVIALFGDLGKNILNFFPTLFDAILKLFGGFGQDLGKMGTAIWGDFLDALTGNLDFTRVRERLALGMLSSSRQAADEAAAKIKSDQSLGKVLDELGQIFSQDYVGEMLTAGVEGVEKFGAAWTAAAEKVRKAREEQEALKNSVGGTTDTVNNQVKWLDEDQKRLDSLTKSMFPAIASQREYEKNVAAVNKAVDLGIKLENGATITKQQAAAITGALAAQQKLEAMSRVEVVTALDKQIWALDQEIATTKLATVEGVSARIEVTKMATAYKVQQLEIEKTIAVIKAYAANQGNLVESIKADYDTLITRTKELGQVQIDNLLKSDAKEAADKLKAQSEEAAKAMQQPFLNAIEGIQSAFSSFFENLLSGGINSFADLASAVKAIFIKLAAEIAALLVFRPVVGEILGSIGLGSLGTSLGLGGTGLAGGAGVLQGAASNPIGALGQVGSLSNLFGFNMGSGGLINSLGTSLGFSSSSFIGPMQPGMLQAGAWTSATLGSVLGAAGLGFMGGGLLASLTGGNQMGGSIGGGLGAGLGAVIGSAIPGVGTVLGALIGGAGGGLLGGLFGGVPLPPRASNRISFAGGSPSIVGSKERNGGDVSAANSLADAISKLFVTIADTTLGQLVDTIELSVGKKGKKFFVGLPGQPKQTFKSPEEAAISALRLGLDSGTLTGVSPEVLTALKKSASIRKTVQEVQDDAVLIQTILEGSTGQLTRALTEINKRFVDMKKVAQELDLPLEKVEELRRKELLALEDTIVASREQLISPLKQMQKELAFGDMSAVTVGDQLGMVRDEWQKTLELARQGNQTAIANLPGAAQQRLQLEREVFASGPEFAAAFRDVNAGLGEIIAEFGLSTQDAIQRQTDRQSEEMKEQTEVLRRIEDLLRVAA